MSAAYVVVRTCRYLGGELREIVGAFGASKQAAAFAAKRNGEQSSFLYHVLTVPLDSEDPDGLDAAQEAAREAAYRAAPPAPLPEGMRPLTMQMERMGCTNTAVRPAQPPKPPLVRGEVSYLYDPQNPQEPMKMATLRAPPRHGRRRR